jgi:hypothetical protein
MDDMVKRATFTIYTDHFWVNDEYLETTLDVRYFPIVQKYIVTDAALDALLTKIDFDNYDENRYEHPAYGRTLELLEEEMTTIKRAVLDSGMFGGDVRYFFRSTWHIKDARLPQRYNAEEDDTEYDADKILKGIRKRIKDTEPT